MKILYLHIGLEKTGSTTLQSFLYENESVLNEHGFTYFCDVMKPYFEGVSHFPIVASLNSELHSFVSPCKNRLLDSTLEQLNSDLKRNIKNVIISNEHFSSRLCSLERLAQLKAVFADYHVKVVCYIRRQDELALASYTTGILCGRRSPFDLDEVSSTNRFFNFLETLEPWAAIFGRENMIVRKFDRQTLEGSDIRRDFLSIIGMKGFEEFVFGNDLNISLDATQVELLRLINQHLTTYEDGDGSAYDRAQLVRQTLAGFLPRGEPVCKMLTSADREIIHNRFRTSNLKLERRFMTGGALASWEKLWSSQDLRLTKTAPPDASDLAIIAAQLACALTDKEQEILAIHRSHTWRWGHRLRSVWQFLNTLSKRLSAKDG